MLKIDELQAGFARRLILARTWRGYESQAALARALGLRDADRISIWEQGQGFPRVMVIYKLCKILGVTSDWLLFGDPKGLPVDAYTALVVDQGQNVVPLSPNRSAKN